mgnify:FL=1
MTEPKRHHYVPQTYLKNFAFKKNNQYKVNVIDKTSRNIFLSNISNIAVEKEFYTVSTMPDKYMWEKYYGQAIEPIMADLFKSLRGKCENCLIVNKSQVINSMDKNYFSMIITIQFLRGIHSRNYEKDIFVKNVPELFGKDIQKYEEINSDDYYDILDSYQNDESLFREIVMKTNIDNLRVANIAQYLINRNWIVYKIVDNSEFVTSDNPVMIMNAESLDVTPFKNGVTSHKTCVFYPISSKLLIGIYSFKDEDFVLNSYDGKLIELCNHGQFINFINNKQLEQCFRQVYSCSVETLKRLK